MKTKKKIFISTLTVLMAVLICACSFNSYMSYTFNVETGDSVNVKLDTSNGLSLTQNGSYFNVMKDGKEILLGMFLTEDNYNDYMSLEDSGDITVYEKGTDGNKKYMSYECEGVEGTEYDFIVWIDGSNTGVLMGGTTGKADVEEAFSALSFSIE